MAAADVMGGIELLKWLVAIWGKGIIRGNHSGFSRTKLFFIFCATYRYVYTLDYYEYH